jgi:predicted transcriptional regulator
MRPLTKEDPAVIRVCELYGGGKSLAQVGEVLGISTTAAGKRLKVGGEAARPRIVKPAGMVGIIPLSKEIHKHPDFVNQCVADLGIKVHKVRCWNLLSLDDAEKIKRVAEVSQQRLSGKNDPSVKVVEELYKSGLSGDQIAEKLGLTKCMVYTRLRYAQTGVRLRGREKGLMTMQSIASSLGRAFVTVRKIVEDNNIPHIVQGSRLYVKEEFYEKIAEITNDDYRLEEVDWRKCGISEWEMGWLGGIIDGEGCIQLHAKNGTVYVRASFMVANTCTAVIKKAESLMARLGVRSNRVIGQREHEKPCYQLRAYAIKDSWRVLKAVYPFLVLKKWDADIFFKFCDVWSSNAGRLRGAVSEVGHRLREELVSCRADVDRGAAEII